MPAPFATEFQPPPAPSGDQTDQGNIAPPARVTLAVERIGHRVPAEDFDGDVHSVFAQVCNIECGDLLLMLLAPDLDDGPTTLRLGDSAPADLRHYLRSGDRVRRRGHVVHSHGVALTLAGATVWCPAPLRPFAEGAQVAANLALADAALARRRRTHSSILAREGGAVLFRLAQACRDFDLARASPHVERLVGWGEGLTPSGDDALVGLCAGLSALSGDRGDRVLFTRRLSAAIAARAHRTTVIAAHLLRLAAQGHFNADVTRLRHALLCSRDRADVEHAVDAALAVGAASGADTLTGMLAGMRAWSRAWNAPALALPAFPA